MGGAPDHDDAPELSDDGSELDDPAFEPTDVDAEPDAEPDAELADTEPSTPFDAGGDLVSRIANAKRRHGTAGGMLAAGMLGVDQVVNGRKPREEAPIVVAANSEPIDIDTDGILVSLAGADVIAPPLPRTAPRTPSRRRRR